ncbi:unnamed protein product [Lathyrus oleraceus]
MYSIKLPKSVSSSLSFHFVLFVLLTQITVIQKVSSSFRFKLLNYTCLHQINFHGFFNKIVLDYGDEMGSVKRKIVLGEAKQGGGCLILFFLLQPPETTLVPFKPPLYRKV